MTTPHPLQGTPRLPIGFAHRGGRLEGRPVNTLGAFAGALSAGARGLESDVWLTADRVPVLLHPRVVFRDSVRTRPRSALPVSVPSIDELYQRCGSDFELSLDMVAPRAAAAVVATAGRHDAIDRLWLTHWRVDVLGEWRRRWSGVRLVFPRILAPWRRPVALLDRLALAGIDALNVHHRQVSSELADLAHERGMLLLAWGLRGGRESVVRSLGHGADGVFVDDVRDMVAAIEAWRRNPV